jgi:hypothetical protein
MKRDYACSSPEHNIARREFLAGMAGGLSAFAGAAGLSGLATPAIADQLTKKHKRVLVIFMSGGVSQLETWDPKPKTDTGGPFRAIPTAVPGTHISELLPKTATHMDKLSLIRSINTNNGDHGKGRYQMVHGRNQRVGDNIPHLGSVCAKALEINSNPLPGHVKIPSSGGGDAAYLGPRYASIGANGSPPTNSSRPKSITVEVDQQRNEFRRKTNDRFAQRRRSAETDIYANSYEQAIELMNRREVFDLTKEPEKDLERYGQFDLGKHCLLARRLLEHDIPYVQVSHSNYDTHNENFNFHLEQLGEFDLSFSTLIQDLHDRGMLESTLVIVMSEFGRTPKINARYGRDHWGTAWSICLGGAKVQPGAVIGKTNANGTAVSDRQVDHGDLFHTYLAAVGVDPTNNFNIGGREYPMADPAKAAISELIS